jgi:hypothetical protein
MIPIEIQRLWAALAGCVLSLISCVLVPTTAASPQSLVLELPRRIGSWEMLRQDMLGPHELEMLQASDYRRRVYRCQETGRLLTATIVAGPSGPLACHQPEVCYGRNEYCTHSRAWVWRVPEREDEFRLLTLESLSIQQPTLTLAYAWHAEDRWRAPLVPRFQFFGNKTLQRLTVAMPHAAGAEDAAELAVQQFIKLVVSQGQEGSREG